MGGGRGELFIRFFTPSIAVRERSRGCQSGKTAGEGWAREGMERWSGSSVKYVAIYTGDWRHWRLGNENEPSSLPPSTRNHRQPGHPSHRHIAGDWSDQKSIGGRRGGGTKGNPTLGLTDAKSKSLVTLSAFRSRLPPFRPRSTCVPFFSFFFFYPRRISRNA